MLRAYDTNVCANAVPQPRDSKKDQQATAVTTEACVVKCDAWEGGRGLELPSSFDDHNQNHLENGRLVDLVQHDQVIGLLVQLADIVECSEDLA